MSGIAYVAKGDGCLVVEAPTQEEARARAARIANAACRPLARPYSRDERILRERETRRVP